MDRVWGSNASSTAPSMPANLETGYPRSSGSGTVPGYWWYHMVTESLRAVVVAAGLTPSASDMTQITQAIQVIAKQSGVSGSLKPVHVLDTVGVSLSGTQTIDGATPGSGARVARSVGVSATNGVYVVNPSGAWSRATDMAVGTEIADGSLVEVNFGNTYANKVFMLNAVPATATIVVGTTPFEMVDITAGITAQLGNYLTTANAAATYLTQTSAATTYATKAEIGDMLTKTLAATLYPTKSFVSNTYATIDSLSSYLTTSAASATYLSKSDANTTYLKKTDAATTYVPLAGVADLNGSYTFTNKTAWHNSHWLYWADSSGSVNRYVGVRADNVFVIGDIDLVSATSHNLYKTKNSHIFDINGSTVGSVDANGFVAATSPALTTDDLRLAPTSWVRDLIATVAGGANFSINIGPYIIKFGTLNSGNCTQVNDTLMFQGDVPVNYYGWNYSFPTAFPTAVDAVVAIGIQNPNLTNFGAGVVRGATNASSVTLWWGITDSGIPPMHMIAIGH